MDVFRVDLVLVLRKNVEIIIDKGIDILGNYNFDGYVVLFSQLVVEVFNGIDLNF